METRKQRLVVVFFFGLFLACAGGASFWVIKKSGIAGNGDDRGYQNVTFTDAVLTCEGEVKQRYKKAIKSLVVDNHSSRYDDKQFTYKIFFNLIMATPEKKHGAVHYINCFVKASSGRVNKFEIFEELDETTDAVREKSTNAFGWPK